MLDFENMVADYVKETQNHVLYRVTPVFEGDNAVANGVLMEAQSVEDHGAGVTFCVYCYNVQPGIVIDYVTGDSYHAVSAKRRDDSHVHFEHQFQKISQAELLQRQQNRRGKQEVIYRKAFGFDFTGIFPVRHV